MSADTAKSAEFWRYINAQLAYIPNSASLQDKAKSQN